MNKPRLLIAESPKIKNLTSDFFSHPVWLKWEDVMFFKLHVHGHTALALECCRSGSQTVHTSLVELR